MVARAYANNMMSAFKQLCPMYSHSDSQNERSGLRVRSLGLFTLYSGRFHACFHDWLAL